MFFHRFLILSHTSFQNSRFRHADRMLSQRTSVNPRRLNHLYRNTDFDAYDTTLLAEFSSTIPILWASSPIEVPRRGYHTLHIAKSGESDQFSATVASILLQVSSNIPTILNVHTPMFLLRASWTTKRIIASDIFRFRIERLKVASPHSTPMRRI